MARTMNEEFERIKTDLQHSSLLFVKAELELARTFCEIGKEADDPQKRERNLENAKKAFQAAVRVYRDFNEPGDDWTSAKATLDEVERQLACVR